MSNMHCSCYVNKQLKRIENCFLALETYFLSLLYLVTYLNTFSSFLMYHSVSHSRGDGLFYRNKRKDTVVLTAFSFYATKRSDERWSSTCFLTLKKKSFIHCNIDFFELACLNVSLVHSLNI